MSGRKGTRVNTFVTAFSAMGKPKHTVAAAILAIATLCGCRNAAAAPDLQLAANGATDYVIVKPAAPTEVDDYAVRRLAEILQRKTKATFPVVAGGELKTGGKAIFVGISKPALKTLGADPLAELKDQEHVARSVGGNVFLYGKGVHGNCYAVVNFLEDSLGVRWYSKFEEPVVRVERDLILKPFSRKRGVDFPYRAVSLLGGMLRFAYWHGFNMSYENRFEKLVARRRGKAIPGMRSKTYVPAGCHTSFGYIPPAPERQPRGYIFGWIAKKDYFKTNPEFFSMGKSRRRVSNKQLCFSNPDLRKELTRNILEHIRRVGEDVIVEMDANDHTGAFCHCPACKTLEQKYASPGGPLYDYLFDLCAEVKKPHPRVLVRTLAYRRSQTQIPPTMPPGTAFPDNLIAWFANVEDKLDKDWNHPVNRPSYEDLLKWCKLTPHVWTWYYPNSYGSAAPSCMPVGNIGRMVNDIRLMKAAGVEGISLEFDTLNVRTGNGFADLQWYVYARLAKDTNADVPAIIKEFTDHAYGPAGALARQYLEELEEGRRKVTVHLRLSPRVIDFDGPFAYLSPDNLHRWQGYFDRMESLAAADARCLTNVRRLRRVLEFATLARWNDLARKYPDAYKDYRAHKARLGKIERAEEAPLADFETLIKAGGQEKPLPEAFRNRPPGKAHRFIPTNKRSRRGVQKVILDPDAAFGYAAVVDLPDFPFHFGFYQISTKTHGPRRRLTAADITPDVYKLHKLGTVTITPVCTVWFSAKSWSTNLELGSRLYEPGAGNEYEIHVSLKFSGPTYRGKPGKDRVLCDQIICVKRN